MRVISGSARGCKLAAPEGLETRPTTDRIKETLFNIISPLVGDCIFLDVFSGSGAVGIEALSRGAKKAYFVENADEAAKVIKLNLTKTRLEEKAELLKTDCTNAVKLLKKQNVKADIVFMDPPYKKELAWSLMQLIKKEGILNQNAVVIVEESSEAEIPQISGFNMYRSKEYKTTVMSFWTLEENNA